MPVCVQPCALLTCPRVVPDDEIRFGIVGPFRCRAATVNPFDETQSSGRRCFQSRERMWEERKWKRRPLTEKRRRRKKRQQL